MIKGLIVFLVLFAATLVNPGTNVVWQDNLLGDSLQSTSYSTKNTLVRGKFFGSFRVSGHSDSCQVKLCVEYANYLKNGSYQWAGRTTLDSVSTPGISAKYYPIQGFGYFRFVVIPWGTYSKKDTIDLVVEIK